MSDQKINLTIDGISVSVAPGTNVLEAAKQAGISIPTLCYLKKINSSCTCKVCVVEIKGMKMPIASCIFPAREGMEVITNSQAVFELRKANLKKAIADHDKHCLSCERNTNCQLQKLAYDYDIDDSVFSTSKQFKVDDSSHAYVRDNAKCINCKRCIAVCSKVQSVNALVMHKDENGVQYVGCPNNSLIKDSTCVECGQCLLSCPVGALVDKDDVTRLEQAIADPEVITVVAPAPSTRVSLGDEFGMPIGTDIEGKLVTAMKMCGFDHVFDIDFGADLTICEEANELVQRIESKKLPMMTSCCRGWVNFVRIFYPEFLPNLSSAKSPLMIMGSALKTYWAEKNKVDPKKIFFVSIMPCIDKKDEIHDGTQAVNGLKDADCVISVREFAKMLKKRRIDFTNLKNTNFDQMFGESTGGAVIFGASGGVMESAVRTAVDWIEGRDMPKIDYTEFRGETGIKEATIKVKDKELKLCAISGLANARKVMDEIKAGTKNYDFIEVMACPGGCINGGGMPIHDLNEVCTSDIIKKRQQALYTNDKNKKIRKSYLNPAIIEMYKDYFEKIGSHKAHELLHTHFEKKIVK